MYCMERCFCVCKYTKFCTKRKIRASGAGVLSFELVENILYIQVCVCVCVCVRVY
jgi:hypothetical protein